MDLRKDKKSIRYNVEDYNESVAIGMEESTLGVAITYKPWWSTIKEDQKIDSEPATLVSLNERTDKKGRLMGFYTLSINDCEIEAISFATTYARYSGIMENNYFLVSGKKDSKGKLLLSRAIPV
jgi:DNA polymerase III alpha subunit